MIFHIFCVIDKFTRLVWIVQVMIINKIFCVFGQLVLTEIWKYFKGIKEIIAWMTELHNVNQSVRVNREKNNFAVLEGKHMFFVKTVLNTWFKGQD